jgi:alcohol dehydrogenase
MKALVYRGKNTIKLEDKPKPEIEDPTDAIVKIVHTTICGSDLHILQGHVPTCKEGVTIGHEGVGIIDQAGDAVRGFKKGDKVLISCITSCASCPMCKKGMYSHCEKGGGWILGHTVDGTQAEYVRIKLADASLHLVPEGIDEKALVMLSDIGPTGYEASIGLDCS